MNPISSAASGLIAASNQFNQASLNLSNAAAGGAGDIASAITDQISAKTQFEASAKVMKATEQTFKDTLNILV
jgi:flagellar basal body rod protein FlgC